MRTPTFQIHMGGEDISSYLRSMMDAGRLVSVTIVDESGGETDTIDIELARDHSLTPPPAGSPVTAHFGYLETGVSSLGDFVVDEVTTSVSKQDGRSLRITGTAADLGGTLKQERHESYHEKTVGDIFKTIAARNGFEAAVDQEIANVHIPHIDQTGESDMHFVTRLAGDLGTVAKFVQNRLVVLKKRAGRSVSGRALIPVAPPAGDILSAEYKGGKRGEFTSVKAFWHDHAKAKRQGVTVGSGRPEKTLKRTFADQAQAQKAAEAALNEATASAQTLNLEVVGDPHLKSEAPFSMPPLEPEMAGDWIILRAEHTCSKSQGYTTHLNLERPS